MLHSAQPSHAPRWVVWTGVALSIALHATVVFFLAHSRIPALRDPETVITVNLIESRPVIASSAAAPGGAAKTPAENDDRDNAPPDDARNGNSPAGNENGRARGAKTRGATHEKLLSENVRHPSRASQIEMPAMPSPREADITNHAKGTSSDYLAALARKLAQVKNYPPDAVARGEEGVVVVSLRLRRDGRVVSWEMKSGSGYATIDAEVADMVRAAAPFPPFPDSWAEVDATFLVPIRFSLE